MLFIRRDSDRAGAGAAEDLADGMKGAGKEAAKLNKSLASFDKMNVLPEKESGSGGGGGAGTGFGRSSRGSASGKFKGQDVEAELNLSLRDAAKTHQQTFEINGKKVRITIPAGIADGQKIKLKGHGNPGFNGGPNGDLYITLNISEDHYFKRNGNNLSSNVEIDLYTAVLGGDVTIPTLDGNVNLKVKPGTQNGTKVRLKGKGFPVYKKEGEFGDLFVTYSVKIPTHLSEKEKELFQELKNLKK